MRKLIASGLGALALASGIALATPATAAVPIYDSICIGNDAGIVSATAARDVAQLAANAADTAFNTAEDNMEAALGQYALSVSSWLKAVDTNTGVALAVSTRDARLTDLATKISKWAETRAAKFSADGALKGAQSALDLLNVFDADLCAS